MFDRRFFASPVGRAALASVLAMGVFVMASTQIAVTPPMATAALGESVVLA
ncbi:hypothetical protein [Qipengyuania sediminis]|uniref:hypothetical protein n=1 Tax=Qipengyuania sediminis TaxID=1532023 RepID=UPI0014054501|nr:hypothetical protein [Qipengyuania sediminis]